VLKEQLHYEVHLLLKKGGPLESEFRKYARVYVLGEKYTDVYAVEKLVGRLHRDGISIAICNTVVSGDLLKILSKRNIKAISLIHEMPELIHEYHMEDNAALVAQYADKVVFASSVVKEKFQGIAKIPDNKCTILPQGLYLRNSYRGRRDEARAILRRKFGLPEETNIVLAVGFADLRKGADLFAEVAQKVLASMPGTCFIWIGHHDDRFMHSVLDNVKRSGLADRILFPGRKDNVGLYYSGCDIYLMTSREDPFPSTVLEAMDAGIPVVGFEDAGGFQDIVTEETGALVPYLDVEAMSEKTVEMLKDKELRKTMGQNTTRLIDDHYVFTDYVYALIGLLGHRYKKVSVIVPNYNYSRYLKARLQSIAAQDYPVYEIIILDDCSSDDSVSVARRFAGDCGIPVCISVNEKNSGSVFSQWAKGMRMARGDHIWIAEADDQCEREFLAETMKGFSDPGVVLSYCQSKQMDENGRITAKDYLYYTDDIDRIKWKADYTRPGIDEIEDTLAVKNTIPNVSGTVFKKFDISEALVDMKQFKVAGDLYFYVWLLKEGKIHYSPKSLNIHRRHSGGVTISGNAQGHFDEIVRMQDYIMEHFTVDDVIHKKVLDYREKVKAQLLGNQLGESSYKDHKGTV
jgi:glycosyltransferase involved in cell wall biosynthesis